MILNFSIGTRHNLWTSSQNGVLETDRYIHKPCKENFRQRRGSGNTQWIDPQWKLYGNPKKPVLTHERKLANNCWSLRGFTVQHVIACKSQTKQFSTHLTWLFDSGPAHGVVISRVLSRYFNPKQSTTLSRTDMLRLCNSVARQVERSQEARNANGQLNS